VAKGVFSRPDGDQREADYLAQQALVASAERNIDSYRANLERMIALESYERITAPFDGIVMQRNADIGAPVGRSGAGCAGIDRGCAQQSAGSDAGCGAGASG
jgi:multidrug efflux pump subunit AcrA (membrane-fusion protein)